MKLSEAILSIFFWKIKIYLFLTPSKTDGRVARQKADLLGSFTADVCPDITGQFR